MGRGGEALRAGEGLPPLRSSTPLLFGPSMSHPGDSPNGLASRPGKAAHAEPKDEQAPGGHPGIPLGIMFPLIAGMAGAIEFDDESGLGAVEIRGVGTHRNLSSELEIAELPIAKKIPEDLLGHRHFAP